MVRKGAILLGVGATVVVGSVGLIAYQLKSARKAVLSSPTTVADAPKSTTLSEPVDPPAAQDVGSRSPTEDSSVPPDPTASVLKENAALLGDKDRALVAQLLELDQGHLFEGWPEAGTDDDCKRRLLDQLLVLDSSYHGGVAAYIRNAKKLLQDSKDGVNPFEGYQPSVPSGSRLDFASPEFMELEGLGLQEAGSAAFVLVAGGLGERLGYSGIKVALPCEFATGTPFLGLYISTILALQARVGGARRLPLAIMTSDDTHARTLELLRKNNYFGMEEDQVVLLKQEKVACLTDNAAHLALEPKSRWALQTKPHGHGDVHMLLAQSGLAKSWLQQGLKWVCFFQDTNALVFRALLAALGVSARHQYDMNSLAVPRKAKEAIGAIARLTRPDGSAPLTINVEYNQLDPLLRATTSPQGDVNDETGFSPFPGNINQLVLKLSSYVPQLEATGGVISEFVNPKYKDATKTEFKSSTRLECMMQDYPKALPPTANIGFTTINQVWASYSPVKNSPADAAAKYKEGNPTHSATTGELDIYKANCLSLEEVAGVQLPAPLQTATFNGITTEVYPRVVLSPAFAPTLAELKSKVAPGSIRLTPGSVLVLDGPDISVQGPLEVQGTLVVRAVPGAVVRLGALRVENQGWSWEPLAEGEQATEEERIRGFRVVHREAKELVFDKPGEYTVADQPAAVVVEEAAEPAPEAPAATATEAAPAPTAADASAPAAAAEEVVAAPAAAPEEAAAAPEPEPEAAPTEAVAAAASAPETVPADTSKSAAAPVAPEAAPETAPEPEEPASAVDAPETASEAPAPAAEAQEAEPEAPEPTPAAEAPEPVPEASDAAEVTPSAADGAQAEEADSSSVADEAAAPVADEAASNAAPADAPSAAPEKPEEDGTCPAEATEAPKAPDSPPQQAAPEAPAATPAAAPLVAAPVPAISVLSPDAKPFVPLGGASKAAPAAAPAPAAATPTAANSTGSGGGSSKSSGSRKKKGKSKASAN